MTPNPALNTDAHRRAFSPPAVAKRAFDAMIFLRRSSVNVKKIVSVSVISLCAIYAQMTYAGDANNCLVEIQGDRGTMCGTRDSHIVEMKNRCNGKIKAQLCLEQTNGRMQCGSNNHMDPGGTVTQYVCSGTGRYRYWGCSYDAKDYGNCGGNQSGNRY